jgi:hypothetical protein
MKDLYQKKIEFPVEMEALNEAATAHKIVPINANYTNKRFTIVHFFKADCDKCINELSKIQTFLTDKQVMQNTNYVFIASAPTKVYVLDAIKKINFSYPVYYEKEYYSFKSGNDLPLEDELFNTMLLNGDNEVLLFGAFYSNSKAEHLFYKTINCGL